MKDHAIAVGRVFLLAALLALLPTPVTSQGDSTTVQVVRVIDGVTDSSDAREVNALGFCQVPVETTVNGFDPLPFMCRSRDALLSCTPG